MIKENPLNISCADGNVIMAFFFCYRNRQNLLRSFVTGKKLLIFGWKSISILSAIRKEKNELMHHGILEVLTTIKKCPLKILMFGQILESGLNQEVFHTSYLIYI